jgi:hypothetical protein
LKKVAYDFIPRDPATGTFWLTLNRVAVEKLLRTKLAKTKLRYDALQTTFLIS